MRKPYSLKDAPSLIEKVFPAQKISRESYLEQKAGSGKTLTALGSYWKGRKPLVLNRACILGALLPATDNIEKDLAIFEMLMGIDLTSLRKRLKEKKSSADTSLIKRSYEEIVRDAERVECCSEKLHDHIWEKVNAHLGTDAYSIPELAEQLGVMRFGHRPKVCDPFCGSGQIPFEMARVGCDSYASDLNPIACMLTWGAFNIVGSSQETYEKIRESQENLAIKVTKKMDALGFEHNNEGLKAKNFLYCMEYTCPQTGWSVPILPTFQISTSGKVIAKLVPNEKEKNYQIEVLSNVSKEEFEKAKVGTYAKEKVTHPIAKDFSLKIKTLRGDYKDENGKTQNDLRKWEKSDFVAREDDIFKERLYCIQWQDKGGKTEFRSVTEEDFKREMQVIAYVKNHLGEWQKKGWIPDMFIEAGKNSSQPILERGWTHWHHLFNPRQLLLCSLVHRYADAYNKVGLGALINYCSRLCIWNVLRNSSEFVFYNQALNTLWNYSCRASKYALPIMNKKYKNYPFDQNLNLTVVSHPVEELSSKHDIYITDPPYGNAVNYEEIYEFFISWLRKDPPEEFKNWNWDSRRSLAIKGEDNDFRQGMIRAFSIMNKNMPDNGMQIIMFTHQSESIWADMAEIIWASGLKVSASWYVKTETDSALKQGNYVTGTIILILRKRLENNSIFRDELAPELKDEIKHQIDTLTGLNQKIEKTTRDENLFSDADLKMAGYAAALRVLTKYSEIDGEDMVTSSKRPRAKKEKSKIAPWIELAATTASNFLVPTGLTSDVWSELQPLERFYLKMVEMEAKGENKLDNYQNFAKTFKVDFKELMHKSSANRSRLKTASEFRKSRASEFDNTILFGVLYALMELEKDIPSELVMEHLHDNILNLFSKKYVAMVLLKAVPFNPKSLQTF